MPLSTEILHVTKISGLRGAPVDRVEVCYKVSHSFCTSAILLVYQAMPCCRFVHGSVLWCTKRCRMAVLYRKTPSGVPSDAARLFCTWKRPLVYQAMPHGCFVHGSALWCTKRYRAAVLYMGAPSGVPSDAGRVSAEYAKEYAESEFEKYRVIQDRLFQSDFDRLVDDNDLLNLSTEQ